MFTDGVRLLLLCLALGILGRNGLIVSAAAVLLALRIARLDAALGWVTEAGVSTGVFLLVLALLAPVAAEKIPPSQFASELLTRRGVVAVALAAVGAYLGRVGIEHLDAHPETLAGLIVGSVLGTVFLRGVPTGPLILAGLTAVLAGALRGW